MSLINSQGDRIFFAPNGIIKTIRFVNNQQKDQGIIEVDLFKKIKNNNIMVIYFYIESIKKFKSLVVILDDFNFKYQNSFSKK